MALEGDDYCLQIGFVADAGDPALWDRLKREIAEAPGSLSGDMSLRERLVQVASMPTGERQAMEEAEATSAITENAEPYAEDDPSIIDDDPGVVPPPSDTGGTGTFKLLRGTDARRQVQDYYCGPATMQMIDGAQDGTFESQASWATDLNTTTAGTWINDITSLTNSHTTWDNEVGNFNARDVSTWTRDRFWAVATAHLGLGAPYIEHPDLNGAYYTYLGSTGNYGGHFQVGRGWQRDTAGTRWIHVFDPFNEPDWTSYTTTTWGPRRAKLADVLKANKENQGTVGFGSRAL